MDDNRSHNSSSQTKSKHQVQCAALQNTPSIMNQPSTSMSTQTKQRATLMAVGGFVVGASAMAALIGLHSRLDSNESASLRGYSSSSAAPAANTTITADIVASETTQTSIGSEAPSQAPSLQGSSLYPTYSPTPADWTLMPTNLPTFDTTLPPTTEEIVDGAPNSLFVRKWTLEKQNKKQKQNKNNNKNKNKNKKNKKAAAEAEANALAQAAREKAAAESKTKAPTLVQTETKATAATAVVTALADIVLPDTTATVPTIESPKPLLDDIVVSDPAAAASASESSNEVGFRLKLYWEEGYYWQERTKETWWCMGCVDGKCEKGSKLELTNCKKKTDMDTTFAAINHGNNGHQLRVTNTDLCLQKMGDLRTILLRPCRENTSPLWPLQLFTDFKKNDKFDLRPVGYKGRCLSNHHHPKAGESIYAESCTKAHKTTTGYWVAY